MQLPALPAWKLPTVNRPQILYVMTLCITFVVLIGSNIWAFASFQKKQADFDALRQQHAELNATYLALQQRLEEVLAEDQLVRNDRLEASISALETAYDSALTQYESLVDLGNNRSDKAEELFALSLSYLAKRNYASSAATLALLQTEVRSIAAQRATSTVVPNIESLPASSTPPDSGFARQAVDTSIGRYQVSIVSADLSSTRVIVDTASSGDCGNDCPVLPLASYVARNGAFAGINGSYFCPASYPACAGKTNTFDTLLMNKDKVYFNSENNVYSTVPAVIFSGNSARFVGRSLEWGRDTGVDAVIANQPLLVSNGSVVFGGDGDPKKGSKGNRSFVGASGSKVYIGVVHNATVAEAAIVLQALGVQNALNLDSGGSTALWSDGYKAGPGRDIPNALLFVRK
jgi:hypothetical protein